MRDEFFWGIERGLYLREEDDTEHFAGLLLVGHGGGAADVGRRRHLTGAVAEPPVALTFAGSDHTDLLVGEESCLPHEFTTLSADVDGRLSTAAVGHHLVAVDRRQQRRLEGAGRRLAAFGAASDRLLLLQTRLLAQKLNGQRVRDDHDDHGHVEGGQ